MIFFAERKANPRKGGEFAPSVCCGMWGRVSDADNSRSSADCTVDVVLSCGILLKKVPVASSEWVVPQGWDESGRQEAAGFRNLPPVGARVFVMMPSGGFADAFVLCSGFPVASDDALAPLFADGEEGRRKKSVVAGAGAWILEYDETTGSVSASSPDGKAAAKIDFGQDGEKKDAAEASASLSDGGESADFSAAWVQSDGIAVSAFGGEVSVSHKAGDSVEVNAFGEVSAAHKKGDSLEVSAFGVTIKIDKDKKIEIKAAGEVSLECDMATLKANEATIDAKQAKITGGTLEVNGAATPTGSGGFCALPACAFSGAVHVGDKMSGT